MADSDSDLEIIDEMPSQNSKSSSYFAGCSADSSDELLDIDDMDVLTTTTTTSRRRKSKDSSRKKNAKSNGKSSMPSIPQKRAPSAPPTVLTISDSEDNGSEATEVVGEDDLDLDSLPSISPSPPSSPANAVDDNFTMETNYEDVNLGRPYQSSIGSSQTSSSKNSLVASNRDSEEFDDMFLDVEYASLGDYLAEIDRKKEKSKLPTKSSNSFNGATTSELPLSTNFAYQAASTTSGGENIEKRRSFKKSKPSSDSLEKPVKSYQVNRKSPTRRKGTQRKGKEIPNVAVASASSSTSSLKTVTPPVPTLAQGKNKQKQPKDVLKMIVLQIGESILSDELAAKMIEKEIQFTIVDSPAITDAIFFEHNVPYKIVEKDQQVREKVVKEMDANAVIIFPIAQHLELLQGELARFDSNSEKVMSLTEWIHEIKRKNSEKKFTLLVQGLEAYLRKNQRVAQTEYRNRVLNGDNPENAKKKRKANSTQCIKLSRYEVQNAFISTSLETKINYRFYENSSDLALLLQQYAKSIGEAPYKKEKMKTTDFDWYAVADAVGGIPVKEKGQGMRSLWLAQLQQFPKVGQESAIAIARIYGSPKELFKAYRRCSTVDEGKNLLTNIQVTMGVGPLAKTRKLGPEASKKIYRFFTSTDGEREIDC